MPKYSEMSGRAENLPGHKPLDKYDLPEWCAHPLKEPSAQPNMLLFPGEQTHYPGTLDLLRIAELKAVPDFSLACDRQGSRVACGTKIKQMFPCSSGAAELRMLAACQGMPHLQDGGRACGSPEIPRPKV